MNKLLIGIPLILAGCGQLDDPPFPAPYSAASQAGVVSAMRYVADHRFPILDANRDGVIDRFREWDAWDGDFILGDQNRDNKLTKAEYTDLLTSKIAVEQFQGICSRLFARLDRDGSGLIQDAEWLQAEHVFSDRSALRDYAWQPFDADANGALDDSEFEDAFSHTWARHGTD